MVMGNTEWKLGQWYFNICGLIRRKKRILAFISFIVVTYFLHQSKLGFRNDHGDQTKEIPYTKEKIVVWAVLAQDNALVMDLLLQSIQGFGVKLIAMSSDSSNMKTVLKKRDENFLSTPRRCSGNDGADCFKSNWIWLMDNAWSLRPHVVCFATDTVALHPDAMIFILASPSDDSNGLQLFTSDKLYPWCFGPTVWKRIKQNLDKICETSNDRKWDSILLDILKATSQSNTIISPDHDLAVDLRNCTRGSDTAPRTCKEKFASFTSLRRSGYKTIDRTINYKSVSYTKSNIEEYAKCRGNICERFQFHASETERGVYTTRLIDGSGKNAYMIDMGSVCINTSKISISRGGENVSAVLGRSESSELPKYQPGAIKVYGTVPSKRYGSHYQKLLLEAAECTDKEAPAKVNVPGTTIAYTRGDYANVCFVVNDLFNIYITMEHVKAQHMLWLDGHALGNLDDVTPKLFDLDVIRIGALDGIRCFEKLILLPDTYLLYYKKKIPTCSVTDFVDKVWRTYNIKPSENTHDTVILRDYYLAHPRVEKTVTRKFTEKELEDIKAKLPNAKYVKFHELNWKDQMQIIANTKTLYGMHGAGLQLGLFLGKGSKMVEWIHPSRKGQMTFENLMTWRPDVSFTRLSLSKWLAENR